MGKITRISKIAGLLILLSMPTWGQNAADAPLVSDKEVAVKDSTVRVVDRDEVQRIVLKMAERQKRLENRIEQLEIKIKRIEKELNGGT